MIHETAIVHELALVHKNVTIGPYSVIGPGVRINANTKIGAHCVIGGPPEHKDHWHEWSYSVIIGSNCFISNHVTIDSGTERHTEIEDYATLLRHCHVGHDAKIEKRTTLSCSVVVGGHATVMDSANCGIASIIHQRCVVGALSMLGMGTIVTKKTPIEPCNTYAGNPARLLKVNITGVDLSGYDHLKIRDLKHRYYLLTAKNET